MSRKPRILVLAGYYLPGHLAGGPIRSIANLVESLSDEFEWLIVTSDRDLGAKEPYPDVPADQWSRWGSAQVFHASPATRAPRAFIRLLRATPHDALYLNSFFDPGFGVAPALARRFGRLPRVPWLVAPRGEFSPGALKIKALKKRGYLALARAAGIYRDAQWHASTDLEKADIRRATGASAARVHVARDLAGPPLAEAPSGPAAGEALQVCFLSRVSRMKNLDYALKVLAAMRSPVDFRIYGPLEDAAYWEECGQILSRLPSHVRASYEGPVPADRVHETLGLHDVLFLPTRGENFGHVLAEAWSAGVPVLTSDRTPWRGLLESGVGWDLPLEDPDGFVSVLEALGKESRAERDARRARALRFARESVSKGEDLARNRALFRGLAPEIPRP